jgi:hypothetical protein
LHLLGLFHQVTQTAFSEHKFSSVIKKLSKKSVGILAKKLPIGNDQFTVPLRSAFIHIIIRALPSSDKKALLFEDKRTIKQPHF